MENLTDLSAGRMRLLLCSAVVLRRLLIAAVVYACIMCVMGQLAVLRSGTGGGGRHLRIGRRFGCSQQACCAYDRHRSSSLSSSRAPFRLREALAMMMLL